MDHSMVKSYQNAVRRLRAEVDELEAAAQCGAIHRIDDYFARHANSRHAGIYKNHLVWSFVSNPCKYPAKDRLLDSIMRSGFDFGAFFDEKQEIKADTIFHLYRKDQQPDTAKAAGVLAAEYLRFRIVDNLAYRVDLDGMLGRTKLADATLSDEAAFVHARNAIIAVQGALVDYVRKEGPSLPLNFGAAMLLVLEDDVRSQGGSATADLWTRKITDIRRRRLESLAHGETIKYSPVFEP